MRHLKPDTRAYSAAAEAEHLDAVQLAALPDAALAVRVPLLRDRIHQGWILTALWLIDAGVTAAALEHTRAASRVSGSGHDHGKHPHRSGDRRAGGGLVQ